MRFDSRNLNIVRAHGLKTNTSKARPFASSADGICVHCANDVHVGTMIVWDRKFGVFHASCFVEFNPGVNAAAVGVAVGVDEKAVRSIVQQMMLDGSKNNGLDSERMEQIVRDALDSERMQTGIRDMIAAFAGPQTITINLKRENGEIVQVPNAHDMMPKLFAIAGRRKKHVYLYGAPGSGKSTAAALLADALFDGDTEKYGYVALNPQTPDWRLLGFIDANGRYVPTVFRKIYEHGGVFCIDEMDNASASLLCTLNGLLENGHGAFPDAIVRRHADFVCIGTGNTAGRGGSKQFPDRRVFDAAFAERFYFLNWTYDEALERRVALSINTNESTHLWVDWVQAVRRFTVQHDPQLVVSPRATFKIADLIGDDAFTTNEVLDAALFKGIESQRVLRITQHVPVPRT